MEGKFNMRYSTIIARRSSSMFLFSFLFSIVCVGSPPDELLDAAHKGKLPAVKAWVEKYPTEINTHGWVSRTLLHVSAGEGHLQIVDYLLEKGANVDQLGDAA